MAGSGNALRIFRQATVLIVGVMIVVGNFIGQARVTSWDETLWVGLYPIAGDDQAASQDYLNGLDARQYDGIEKFLASEAKRYGLGLERPFRVNLGQGLDELPPSPPPSGNMLGVMYWSLKFRFWAWRSLADQPGPDPDIRIFLIYHDPKIAPRLPHSLGLKEGRIGIAHVFADRRMRGSNNVVIAHEMLHTLGATDKYDLATGLPRYPDGYAEPAREPVFPQEFAEIMGGRVPIAEDEAKIPNALQQARIGALTASELRWPPLVSP